MDGETERTLVGVQTESNIPPLAAGTTLVERYTIRALKAQEHGRNVYRVGEPRTCLACGVENDGSANVCGFCGTELPPAPELVLVEQPMPKSLRALPPLSFVVENHLYTLTSDASTAALRAFDLHLTHGVRSDAGIRRGARGEPNEDAVFALTLTSQANAHRTLFGLYVVADGVGGAAAGEVASQLAVETVVQEIYARILTPLLGGKMSDAKVIRAELAGAVKCANEKLIAHLQTRQLASGTTLALALIVNSALFVVNVGDSRVYLARAGQLDALTRDHSYVAMLVERGALASEEIYEHPQRNLILKSLGDPSGFEFDLLPREGGAWDLQAGDQVLLCTDGLWEMVRDSEIAHVLNTTPVAPDACAQLTSLANGAGGADNISVILVRV